MGRGNAGRERTTTCTSVIGPHAATGRAAGALSVAGHDYAYSYNASDIKWNKAVDSLFVSAIC
jgi:hypothetical protein